MINDRSANQADRQSPRSTSTQRTTTEETISNLRNGRTERVDPLSDQQQTSKYQL